MVRARELAVVGWSAATFGALLASYSAFRPVRDALILDGDPDQIPWLFTATFAAVLVVSPLWSALIARRSPRRYVAVAFHAFAACALGFFALVRADIAPVTVGRIFYVWSAVFSLFVVSVFWSLLADLLGPGEARRLYGPIAAGGTVGSFVGPLLTKLLVGTIGVAGILAMTAVLLELAVIGVSRLQRAAGDGAPVRADEPKAAGPLAGIAHVARSPYLAAIVGYVLCTAFAATFLYLAQLRIVRAALPTRELRTDYAATLELWTAAATLALQTLAAGPALRWFGPGIVLAALPLAQLAGISAISLAPSLLVLGIVVVASKAATHGLTRPARELLFTVVGRDDKYHAKNAIDTIAYRLGDFASSWLSRGLAALGAGAGLLVGATVPLVAVWLALAAALGAGFRKRARRETAT